VSEHNRPAHRESFSDHHSIWLSSNDRADEFVVIVKRGSEAVVSMRLLVAPPRMNCRSVAITW
jgi:hypothetical protein